MVDQEQNSQGLYTPELEHDACGIGFVAHLKNRKSHDVVTQALICLHVWNTVAAKAVIRVLVMVQVSCYRSRTNSY